MYCDILILMIVLRFQIEDNITQEYRADESKVPSPPEPAPKEKSNLKTANTTARKSKIAPNTDDMMEAFMKRCLEYVISNMMEIPDQVAEVTRPLCF
jgi:hypothetical protein